MTRLSTLVLLVSFPTGASPLCAAPPAPGVFAGEPPAAVERLIARAKDGDADAVTELAARPDAAPYLRLALKPPGHLARGATALADALEAAERRAGERNRTRYAAWLAGGRLDLCAEVLVACPDKKDALEMADATLPVRARIARSCLADTPFFPPDSPEAKFLFRRPTFNLGRPDLYTNEAGTDLALPLRTGGNSWGTLIRADRCSVAAYERISWFVAARTEAREELDAHYERLKIKDGVWTQSVLLINNDARLPRLDECLVVCDGDVELMPNWRRSVVVANGNIRGRDWGGGASCLAATGDIALPGQRAVGRSVLHAGGTVTLGAGVKPTDRVREHQALLPFGLRFFDPADLGADLGVQDGGVRVRGLAAWSPLTAYGVAAGDVIVAIDDVPATTLPAVRRQLRRGLVAESSVLQLRRGENKLIRVVFFDGIPVPPTPTAPAPHEPNPTP
jgi:hypothetical protein